MSRSSMTRTRTRQAGADPEATPYERARLARPELQARARRPLPCPPAGGPTPTRRSRPRRRQTGTAGAHRPARDGRRAAGHQARPDQQHLTITDPDGNQLTSIAVKAGETIQFEVTNTAGFDHNFYIGTAEELSNASGSINGGTGIPTFTTGTQTLT